jgi:UDPglucose 6-dehydrogenase
VTTLGVVGLGKLGAPMAACFANKGFLVIGADVNSALVEAVNEGRPPVFEPELAERLAAGRAYLTATTDTGATVGSTDATFIVVPTPSDEDGGFSLRYVLPACEQIGQALREKSGYHLVVLTSTVMPGATDGPVRAALEEASGKRCGEDFGLCYSPEFIALGSAIRDFLNPDFLLVGESDARAGDMLAEIYSRLVENHAPVARMNFVNAELAKLSVNTFITTKIAFANMLARVCEQMPGADVDVVTSALGRDSRIGSKYLRGAVSYGGPCFPRDTVAFAALANGVGAPAHVAEATDQLNRDGIRRLADLVRRHLPEAGTAAVLGLSYKPNTDVIEESPGLLLAQTLVGAGVNVVAYDPLALAAAERALGADVAYAESSAEAIRRADVIVLTTAWSEFGELQPELFARDGEPRTLIDCWRLLSAERFGGATRYVALGEGAREPSTVTFN